MKAQKIMKYVLAFAISLGGIVGLLVVMTVVSLEELWANIVLGISGMMVGAWCIYFGFRQDPKSKGWIAAGIAFALMCLWMIVSYFLI